MEIESFLEIPNIWKIERMEIRKKEKFDKYTKSIDVYKYVMNEM